MNSKERMMIAINKETPDRLPVTIHQWQPYHLNTFMNGMSDIEACREVGIDAAITYYDVSERQSDAWQIETKEVPAADGIRKNISIKTPKGVLTTQEGSNKMTTWVTEHLVKNQEDIYILRDFMPVPLLNKSGTKASYEKLGDDGILRTFLPYKQGGCWQDACELYGAEAMIFACFDDPEWVHEFLQILLDKKLQYVAESLPGMPFDLIETGGGASSNTLISPAIHEEFCLPYDQKLHDAIKSLGFPVVYHTCGGMSKITNLITQNHSDVSETLSPSSIGGDIDSDETARKVYSDLFPQVALIGGFDQVGILEKGSPLEISSEVDRLFELFGKNGGYIMSAADHFFTVPPKNLKIYAEAAKKHIY